MISQLFQELYLTENIGRKNQQIYSPEFKAWFGDWENNKRTASKVVDQDGYPLVVFHGTKSDVHQFSYEYVGKGIDQYGSGFYFTSDPSHASGYADGHGNVMPVFLSIKKPLYHDATKTLTRVQISKFIMNSPILDDALSNFGDVEYQGRNRVIKDAVDIYVDSEYTILQGLFTLSNDFYRNHEREFSKAVTKILGYDGIIVPFPNGEKFFVAFHDSQIKSAIGNIGTFSKKSGKVVEASNC